MVNNKLIFLDKRKFYQLLLFLIVVVFVLSVVLFKKHDLKTYFENYLLHQSIQKDENSVNKTINELLKNAPHNFVKETGNNPEIYAKSLQALRSLNDRNVSSQAIIIKENEQYFYLMDTSTEETALPHEPFTMRYKTEEDKYFEKINLYKESRTYIHGLADKDIFTSTIPIIQHQKICAYIVIDYKPMFFKPVISVLRTTTDFLFIISLGFILTLITFVSYILWNSYNNQLNYINPQTKIYTRSYLMDNYDSIPFRKYFVALIDIDYFKRVNDLYGQIEGDKILKIIAQKIKEQLNPKDVMIEYAGEEFLILFWKNSYTDIGFKKKLQNISDTIENLDCKSSSSENIKITLSMGVVLDTQNIKTLQDVVYKADTSLYRSKSLGRNQITYYSQEHEKLIDREKLRELIEQDKLLCYYQPIVDLKNYQILHYESLLRIKDEHGKLIYPDKILPIIENSYLSLKLSQRVLEYNIKMLKAHSTFVVSVNLNAEELLEESIYQLLVKNTQFAPRLHIELLESKEIDYDKVELVILELKEMGYHICIDDFGAGYANITHILNFPIDYLKFDGSIVRQIQKDKKTYNLMKSITDFCINNDIKVIAEYVENERVVDMLREMGVYAGQGFYFSKGKPFDEL
ncbi:MAG: EAL domain-containing protein [Sulfurovum sp.]|nr:MAG: EAL domain-containing protein [Sulfurovum sp.]